MKALITVSGRVSAMKMRAAYARPMGVAVLLGLMILGGCALPEKPLRPAVYDFGPGLTSATSDRLAAGMPALALAEVEAPAALDSTAVLYRLAYADARQLRPYAQARWSMTPAQLLRQRLREALAQQRPVLNAGEGGGNTLLRVELEEFSQLFEAPERSVGLLRLRATLLSVGPTGERLLAQRSVVVQRPATAADAAGGVRALAQASDAATTELVQWLQQQGR